MKSNHFNRIAIIQSLPQGDQPTGVHLHEDIGIYIKAHRVEVNLKLHVITTREDFFAILSSLTEDARRSDLTPILHIETHGNENGIELASGDFLLWEDLKDSFIDLNTQSKNNLFITLAACSGAYLVKTLSLTDRAPCWGLVGPKKTILPNELLSSFSAYYRELLATGDGGAAMRQLKIAAPQCEDMFYLTISEIFFEQVFNKYLAVSCSEEAIKDRVRRIRDNCKGTDIPNFIIDKLKRKLADPSEAFEKYKSNFFMIDLYPENEKRFTVKYADLKK